MERIVIYGAGGMGRETALLVNDINANCPTYELVGYSVDEDYYADEMEVGGYKVYSRRWLVEHKDDVLCACAIGYPKERREVMKRLRNEGVRFATLVHPVAHVAEIDKVGEGSVIAGYALVSEGVTLGCGVFLNSMVIIGHDCNIGDYVSCFPKAQISGGCRIGEAVSIGAMSYIHEKKTIGDESVVAPGSIVLRNVKPRAHAMGNPAKMYSL